MKTKFKKIFSIILSIGMMLSMTSYVPVAKADATHVFSLTAYDQDYEGTKDGDELSDNANVEPGQEIQIAVNYAAGDNPQLGFQFGVTYDKNVVEPVFDEGEIAVEYNLKPSSQGGPWPAKGTTKATRNVTAWTLKYKHMPDYNKINFLASDGDNKNPFTGDAEIAYIYFKVKDTAPAGSVAQFGYDESYTMVNNNQPLAFHGVKLNVFGEMGAATTLNKLEVKNGTTTYPLNPTFTPDSDTTKEFNTTVPNQISSVDVNAVATDEYAVVASGTGSNNLNVGNNDINIIVQAQDGTQDTYKLHVYRLSDDATLSSLSLTNNVNIGTFNKTVTNYTAIVPYSTTSTSVSATATDANATVKSGTGLWNLTSYGTTINTKNIVVEAENCKTSYASVPGNACTTKNYKLDITRTAPSNNADLSDLKVDGTTITGFNAGQYSYDLGTVANSKTKIVLDATVSDTGKARITSTLGSHNLSVGDNTVDIKVQAEDGSEKTYTIKIKRLSNNSNLSSLTVTSNPTGKLSPNFSKTGKSYTFTAPATATSVVVNATVEDTGKATIVSGPGTYQLGTTNSVNVLVTAEDGTQSTYTVNLVREKSNNANLASLSLDGYNLNETFSPTKTSYTATVSGTVTKVGVSATVEDTGKATIVSGTGDHNLVTGDNTIIVRVKAENGATKDYTIKVTKSKKTISSLTDLKVDGQSVKNFREDVTEYTLDDVAFDKKSVTIAATLKDTDSTVIGVGTQNLKTGDNELFVTVTAEDGTTQTTYKLKIKRAKDNNAYLKDIKIDGQTIDGFNKITLSYGVTVKNDVTSLNLIATPESENASAAISDNSDFVTTTQNTVKITVTAEDGTMNIYKIYVTREKSENNYLTTITVSDGTLTPVFDKTKNDYTVDVDRTVTNVSIAAIVEDPNSSYTISGPSELSIGANTYKIKVTSEDGKDNIYTVIVNRKQSDNNYLSDLTIDGVTISGFSKAIQTYNVTVPSNKNSITVAGQTEEVHATTSGMGKVDLTTGTNNVDIVVKAENGDERTYSLVVTKEKSSNSALSSLSITQTSITPTFDPATYNYTASVEYSVTNIDIVATAEDSNSTITGDGNKNLATGDNTFAVVVTSENNTSSTYTIVVTRSKNNNANLSNITLSDGFELDKVFSPNDTSYKVSVPNTTSSITINALAQDPNVTSITGAGQINLSTGKNSIDIVVTAEDGTTTKMYTIDVDRAKSNDASLLALTVNGGELNPIFEKNTLKYKVTVPNEIDTFLATYTKSSSDATVSVDSDTSLPVGKVTKNITVTAEDGTLRVYEIEVTRQPSTNNFLSSLSVKDSASQEYIIGFNKTKLTYDINVENNINSVVISAIEDDSNSIVSGAGTKTLDIGNNTYNVVVKSASDIERTYVINIFRKANSNNNLSSLEVENQTLSPAFNKNVENYTVNVDSNVTKAKINATPEVDSSVVTGTGEVNLVSGVNTFNVVVTAEDTTTKTYVIVINKAASTNNNLASLTVTPGTFSPDFNKDTTEYNMSVDNSTKSITILATSEDSTATIEGLGVKDVIVGSQTFDVVVTAEDSSIKTYKINVTRAASSVKDLKKLTVNGELVEGFNKDLITYNLNVDNNVTKVTIDAEVVDETSRVTGTGDINLSTGNNAIPVTVTAEDGSVKVYTVNINRAKSANNYLSALNISEGVYSPEFNKETLTYSVTVPYEVTSLNIEALREDVASTVAIDNNSNFVVGDNNVNINVTAENGDIRTYKVKVSRQEQTNNFLTSIIVKGNDGVNYPLKETFNKETNSYTVEIPESITDVDITVTKENDSHTVTGDGNVTITALPQIQRITVRTPGGLERTYTLNFEKGLSSNNKLTSLSVDKGTLNPAFDQDTTEYSVELEEGTESLSVTANKGDSKQTITGDGTKSLKPGTNVIKVIVTAENGSIKTYTINARVKTKNDANGLTSLSVDKGSLSPAFDKDTKLYTVDLDESEENITISATGPNSITGTGLQNLDVGANVFEVVSTDKEGNENIYRVIVNRGTASGVYLKYLAVDNYKLNEKFNKENTNYTMNIYNSVTSVDVIAIPENKNANVTITGNENMILGENNITITVTDENSNTKTYTIKVMIGSNKITSNIHTIDDNYIRTVEEGKTSGTLKGEMTNPKEYLKVYDLDGTEISDNDIVGTGFVMKLIISGTEYDSKVIIVKGDINGDGEVGVADIIKIRLHILEVSPLSVIETVAADTNNDDDIGVADLVKIRTHILGNSNLYAKEAE